MNIPPVSTSWFCHHCGYRNVSSDFCTECRSPNPLIQRTPQPVQPAQSSDFACPHCRAEQTMSFEIAWASNTTTGKSSTLAWSPGTGIAVAGTASISSSLLAEKVTPPIQPNGASEGAIFRVGLIAFAVTLVLLNPIIVSSDKVVLIMLAFGVSVFAGYYYWKNDRVKLRKKQKEYKVALNHWRNSMICLRCGFTWARG